MTTANPWSAVLGHGLVGVLVAVYAGHVYCILDDTDASLLSDRKGRWAVRFTCDPRYNVACIRHRDEQAEGAEAIRPCDEVVVDIAPDGAVYGIELLNAGEQLRFHDGGELIVINEATGERTSLPLTGMPAA